MITCYEIAEECVEREGCAGCPANRREQLEAAKDVVAGIGLPPDYPTAPAPVKDGNPKDGIGATKLPLSLVPPTATALASLAHLDGALKYGKWNWRVAGVRASVYIDAAARHLAKWASGEEVDPDSGLPHLAHAMACLNIIVDARACGKLVDDRAPRVDIGAYFAELTPHVKRLTESHKDKAPRHYTVADSEDES